MMWLKIDSEVAEIHFRLRGYCEPNTKYKDDEWCLVDLAVRSNDLNYSLYNDEALEIGEVRMIEAALETALSGKIAEPIHFSPMEPYMEFDIYPPNDSEDRFEITPRMVWRIILWGDKGTPTDSNINIVLYEEEMRMLLAYLGIAKGENRKHHSEIVRMLGEGNLYGDTFADDRPEYERVGALRLGNLASQSNPISKKDDTNEKALRGVTQYNYCEVYFEEGDKAYCYIADDDSYKVGDMVLVPAGRDNHEAVVCISDIRTYTEENAPYPVAKTKHIIRKISDSEFDAYLRYGNLPDEDKVGVMLRAKHINWGLSCDGDWNGTYLKVLYSGDAFVRTEYGRYPVDRAFYLDEDILLGLGEALDIATRKGERTNTDGCDGTAYEFVYYDAAGNVLNDTGLGYIYGNKSLEDVADLFEDIVGKADININIPPPDEMKSAMAEEIGGKTAGELMELINSEPMPEKEWVLSFMRSFECDAAAAMSLYDRITSERVSTASVCGYTYKNYYWDDEDIYHFEQYNFPLDSRFVVLATLPIREHDMVYIIPYGRIGEVIDVNRGIYTVECCNVNQAKNSDKRWSLYSLERKEIRCL